MFTIIEQLEIKSPEVVGMKRLHSETQKNLMKEIESLNITITRLERENKAISICCEVDLDTFEETIKNYEYSKKEIEYYKREANTSKAKIESLMSQLDKLNEEENTTMESMRSKNLALDLELQNMTDKYMTLKGKKSDKKAKEKEKEKEKKKKEKEKEKKKLKELKKKLESDSDSGSDSDSD
jgi:DNA-directed RNA polymerase III subunit RPC6